MATAVAVATCCAGIFEKLTLRKGVLPDVDDNAWPVPGGEIGSGARLRDPRDRGSRTWLC